MSDNTAEKNGRSQVFVVDFLPDHLLSGKRHLDHFSFVTQFTPDFRMYSSVNPRVINVYPVADTWTATHSQTLHLPLSNDESPTFRRITYWVPTF